MEPDSNYDGVTTAAVFFLFGPLSDHKSYFQTRENLKV